MENNININWPELEKQISGDDYAAAIALRNELHLAGRNIQKLIDANEVRKREQIKKDHIARMKALKPQTKVYFTGTFPELVGKAGFKIKSGTVYMHAAFNGRTFSVPYDQISDHELTPEELKSKQVGAAIQRLFST